MGLFAQLLARQLVENRHLLSEQFRSQKAGTEELDLANQFVVRYYADHRPEEGLDGLRKFRTTGVSRIHRDKDPHFRIQYDILTFKLLENT